MIQVLKRILPASARRLLRPITLAYQQKTQGMNARRLFGNFIAPGDLVFDIGANTGRMTDLFLSLGARVVAVEPQPACVQALNRQFSHQKRATLLPIGVSDKAGHETMNICGDINEVSSFDPEWEKKHHAARWTSSLRVPMATLDDLIALHGLPAYCKIDVEGYESKVLAGLSKPIPFLSFEHHQHHRSETIECLRRLKDLGRYVYNFAPHEEQRLQIDGWHPGHILLDWIESEGYASGDIFARLA